MDAVGKRRLLKLADFLETGKIDGKFNMESWALDEENGRPKCGTQACAMGWATTIPSFRQAGLFLNEDLDPEYKGSIATAAAAEFFRIHYHQAAELFIYYKHANSGMTARRAVAKKIRKLIALEEKRAA